MHYFPRPYPDELLGSMVARACKHLGVAPKPYIQEIIGKRDGQLSFFLPSDLSQLSLLTKLSPQYLLTHHSILPYACAFMSPEQAQAIQERITSTEDTSLMLSSLVQSITYTTKALKCCEACIQEDLARYGETYWRRAHFLPGLFLCVTHKQPLLSEEINRSSLGRTKFTLTPPNLTAMQPIQPSLPYELLYELANNAVATLTENWQHQNDWSDIYRKMALDKGYGMAGNAIAGSQLSCDLQQIFGEPFLMHLKCGLGTRLTASWPALMVRTASRDELPFSSLKHILLRTFLDVCDVRTAQPDYRLPGKESADYQALDIKSVQHIEQQWAGARRNNRRLTVQELLQNAGVYSAFRHDRLKFPRTVELLKKFKESDQAERQAGYRLYWRKRLGIVDGKRPTPL